MSRRWKKWIASWIVSELCEAKTINLEIAIKELCPRVLEQNKHFYKNAEQLPSAGGGCSSLSFRNEMHMVVVSASYVPAAYSGLFPTVGNIEKQGSLSLWRRLVGSHISTLLVCALLGVPGDQRHPHKAGRHDTEDQDPSGVVARYQMRYPGHLKQSWAPIFRQPDPTKDGMLWNHVLGKLK